MNIKNMFIINTVVAAIFGLAFVLFPAATLALYGVELNVAGLFISRLLGAAFLGYAVITWQMQNSAASAEQRAVLLGLLLGDAVGFVISLIYQLQGIANALGWSTVLIYLLLSLAWGYFYMKKA